MEVEEENFNDLEIKWKILLVIGRVNICFDDKIIELGMNGCKVQKKLSMARNKDNLQFG